MKELPASHTKNKHNPLAVTPKQNSEII